MSKRKFGYLSIFLAAAIFSTMEVALKSVSGVFSPLQITSLRFLIGGICLIPFVIHSLKKRGEHLEKKDFLFFVGEGLLCVVFGMVCYQMAIQYCPASVVAIIFSINALFTTLFAGLILKEPLEKHHFIALALEVTAILFIVNPFQQQLDMKGVILGIISAVFFSLYGVAGRRRSVKYGSLTVTCGSVLSGSLILILCIFIGRIPAVSAWLNSLGLSLFADVPLLKGIPGNAWLPLLYVSIVVSAGGYVFYMLAFENTSGREAALVYFIKPILAPLIALVFLRESIPLNMWIGIALFLLGAGIAISLIKLPGHKKTEE